MVEKLTPLADGVTLVPMKKELSIVTLDVISNVSWRWGGGGGGVLACFSYSAGFSACSYLGMVDGTTCL